MNTKNNFPGDLSTEEFLASYWQKKPLLIKNAFPDFLSPISADELAGLACEDNVNARLVLEKDGDYPWQVEFGPFDESRFAHLPESHWSLLVSDVEKHLPETKYLLQHFRFIPDWRVDDLMISYAPEGGSVGQHTDAYDVFLIQLSGQRLWKIAENFAEETLNDVDLCVLKNFTAEHEWLVSPGDMIYLPPNVAHHGIAQDNGTPCLTGSVGFRAPSLKTITSDYVNYLNENVHDASRYRDIAAVKPEHHAEISQQTINDFIAYLKQGLAIEHEHVTNWLGQYCSDNKTYEDMLEEQQLDNFDELLALSTQHTVEPSPYSNFLFSRINDSALLFVNGSRYQTSLSFATVLCNGEPLDFQQLLPLMTTEDKKILLMLFNTGAVIAIDNT